MYSVANFLVLIKNSADFTQFVFQGESVVKVLATGYYFNYESVSPVKSNCIPYASITKYV
jgi:hypothetical protein